MVHHIEARTKADTIAEAECAVKRQSAKRVSLICA